MTFSKNQLIEVQITDPRLVGSPTTTLTGAYIDEASLDMHLSSASAAYYTAPVLANMTQNDKVFAVRFYVDPLSFGTPGTTTGQG